MCVLCVSVVAALFHPSSSMDGSGSVGNGVEKDEEQVFLVVFQRKTLKQCIVVVGTPTNEEDKNCLLEVHKGKKPPSASMAKMFENWINVIEESRGKPPCDFCEAISNNSHNLYHSAPYRTGDLNGYIPTHEPRMTIGCVSYTACGAPICREKQQKLAIDVRVRCEKETGRAIRVPIAVQSCAHCGRTETEGSRLKKCMGCKHAAYCSEECQRANWKMFHKRTCKSAEFDRTQDRAQQAPPACR